MAVASTALAILCYISPNPLPMHISVSGDPAKVAEIRAMAEQGGVVKLVAAAEDRGIAFARFELDQRARYRDIGGLIFKAQVDRLLVATGTAIPSCPDGGVEDLGNPHAPLSIGLVGDAAALDRLKPDLAWARLEPLRLSDGRTGWHFAPSDRDEAAYPLFIQRAASGKIEGVAVVRLLPRDAREN
jgi:hypothetical protein